MTLPSGPLHPNLAWPTDSGITESEAESICQAPILEATAVFELCRNYTMESLEVITESCMLDLQVSKVFSYFREEICLANPYSSRKVML